MLIHDKKHFTMGLVMMIGFAVVLIYMFTPSFGGMNAFEASDEMFNSISKGSTYYIPQVQEGAKEFSGNNIEVNILADKPEVAKYAAIVFAKNGFQAEAKDGGLAVSGDLGAIFQAALQDSDSMFKNDGQAVSGKYGMDEKQALYVWHTAFGSMDKALKKQKKFKESAYLHEVVARGVEVGYNYYGIEGQSVGDRAGMIVFDLVFYVIYTMWYGFAVFFLFEGFGLQMTAGKKKEV